MRGASPALVAHIAQEAAARLLALAFMGAAVLALAFYGKGPALALALVGAAFHMARPGPSADLDKVTGRGQ